MLEAQFDTVSAENEKLSVPTEIEVETAYALTGFQMAGYELGGEMHVTATAYDACVRCCGKTDGITRSGTKARINNTIAVDPSVIPLGTKIYIPELGRVFTAEDTGGAIKGNRIDIFMDNHAQAKDFGVQNFQAYILKGSQQN